MDDDSVNFGSDAAGATPGSILAQPPLQGEGTPGQDGGSGQGEQESMLCPAPSLYRRLT
jgi:SWI/SNF related-matrix-associated actin-dependent regulator of chromatin subfamily C